MPHINSSPVAAQTQTVLAANPKIPTVIRLEQTTSDSSGPACILFFAGWLQRHPNDLPAMAK